MVIDFIASPQPSKRNMAASISVWRVSYQR